MTDLNIIGKEILKLAKEKGFPTTYDKKDFLINRIQEELEEVKAESEKEKIKEELIDVLIQTIQLLAIIDKDIYRNYKNKMDKNWKRNKFSIHKNKE